MLDEDGLARFSMRRLAADLGVAPMTIYHYFATQEELFDAVVDHGAPQLEIPVTDAPWREQLEAMFRRLHRALTRHPFLVELRLRRPMISAGALRFTEAGYQLLETAGFPSDQIPWLFRHLFTYTFGHAGFGPHGSDVERRHTAGQLAVLPPSEYPAVLAAAGSVMASLDGEALFEHGLGLLLDAIERHPSLAR